MTTDRTPRPITLADIEDDIVDAAEIARRVGVAQVTVSRSWAREPWFPAAARREVNGGRWWLWPEVVGALDKARPGWRDGGLPHWRNRR